MILCLAIATAVSHLFFFWVASMIDDLELVLMSGSKRVVHDINVRNDSINDYYQKLQVGD